MSRFLEAIGLHVMTNREALMEELDALDDEAFEKALDSVSISDQLGNAMCADCEATHGGKCPYESDDECPHRLKDWLSQPCRRKQLIDFSEVVE